MGRPRVMDVETVAKVRRLRAEGLSMGKIAAELTAQGVPTAHGGAMWHASTVKRVLDAAE